MEDKGISVDNRSAEEIDNGINTIEKEVKRLLLIRGTIQDEYNRLKRDEIELDQKKLEIKKQRQDLKIRLDKSRSIIGDMEMEIKLERRKFWNTRNA